MFYQARVLYLIKHSCSLIESFFTFKTKDITALANIVSTENNKMDAEGAVRSSILQAPVLAPQVPAVQKSTVAQTPYKGSFPLRLHKYSPYAKLLKKGLVPKPGTGWLIKCYFLIVYNWVSQGSLKTSYKMLFRKCTAFLIRLKILCFHEVRTLRLGTHSFSREIRARSQEKNQL